MSPESIKVQASGVLLGWKTAAAVVALLVGGPISVVRYLDNRFDRIEDELALRPTYESIEQLRTAVLEMQIRERMYDAGLPAGPSSPVRPALPAGGR